MDLPTPKSATRDIQIFIGKSQAHSNQKKKKEGKLILFNKCDIKIYILY